MRFLSLLLSICLLAAVFVAQHGCKQVTSPSPPSPGGDQVQEVPSKPEPLRIPRVAEPEMGPGFVPSSAPPTSPATPDAHGGVCPPGGTCPPGASCPPLPPAPGDLSTIPGTTKGLIEAGRDFPGARIVESELHPALMAAAADQAAFQARIGQQGHQNFGYRSAKARQDTGCSKVAEICAESWAWQANDTMVALGHEMWKCWRQSSGHWSVASTRHRYYGIDMAQGGNGIWYACAIVAD